MKIIYSLLLISSLINLESFAQTSIPGGNVSGTWNLAGSPYNIQGSITVPNDSTLTIEPGVTAIFQGTYQLLVFGRLLAIGTPTNKINFTAADTTNGWRSIRFDNTLSTNDTSKFIYCILKYSKATIDSSNGAGGAFYFFNFYKAIISHCSITNCTAEKNGGAICCFYLSGPIISYNTISNNISNGYGGGGIYCSSGSSAFISYNIISNNSANNYYGGGIYCESSSPPIFNNTISNNSADFGGGIHLDGGSPEIFNNTISNNSSTYSGGGIYCGNNSIAMISNNIISNNSAISNGGGILCYDTSPGITNNTICNNNAANGGALHCSQSNPTLSNCILWGNTVSTNGAQVYLGDCASNPKFAYCDVQGDSAAFFITGCVYSGIYLNNINADPKFVSPSSGSGLGFNGVAADWTLQSNSPCINSGEGIGNYPAIDIAGNPREVDGCIDIGAYEFQGSVGINTIAYQNTKVKIYPNPFTHSTSIEIFDTRFIEGYLYIYDIFGQVVHCQILNSKPETLNLNLPGGVYFYKVTRCGILKIKETIATGKLMIQ